MKLSHLSETLICSKKIKPGSEINEENPEVLMNLQLYFFLHSIAVRQLSIIS